MKNRSASNMQKMRRYRIALAATAALVLLTGCMDPLSQGGHTGYAGVSVMNAPSTIEQLELVVSGPGMSPIGPVVLSSGSSSVVLEVPTGRNRVFDLDGGWYTFRRVAGLTSRGLDVSARMRPLIVVPDRLNYRLVIMKDMSGRDWQAADAPGNFIFRGTDFDSHGNLLVSGFEMIQELRALPRSAVDATANLAQATYWLQEPHPVFTFDRSRDLVYFFGGTSIPAPPLRRASIDPSTSGNVVGDEVFTGIEMVDYVGEVMLGMTVDPDGFLYIVTHRTGDDRIVKLNVSGAPEPVAAVYEDQAVLDFFQVQTGFRSSDILFAGGSIYVLNPGGADGSKILRFSTELELTGAIGRLPAVPADPQPGEFYGPDQFIVTTGRPLIIMDAESGQGETPVSRLVALNDVDSTAGWTTFGEYGAGDRRFNFR